MSESAMDDAAVIRLTEQLLAEVNNGGFDQYFFNSSGDNAEETIHALEIIGATKTAALLWQACLKFPGGMPPIDLSIRRRLMLESVSPESNEFDQLDEEFYLYEEKIGELLEQFKRINKYEDR